MPTTPCLHCAEPAEGRHRYCPDCRDTGAPWRVDEEALAAACERLGLTVRVVVRRVGTRRLLGRYHGIRIPDDAPRDPAEIHALSEEELDDLMRHFITVSARTTPEAASRVLWHELTHAAQFERDPDLYVAQYQREMRAAKARARQGVPYADAYRDISFEVEAKANEELHYLVGPLTRANKRANMPPLPEPHERIGEVVDGRIVAGPRLRLTEDNAVRAIRHARRQMDHGLGPSNAVDLRPPRSPMRRLIDWWRAGPY